MNSLIGGTCYFSKCLKNIVKCFDDKSASKDDKDRIGNKCFEKKQGCIESTCMKCYVGE